MKKISAFMCVSLLLLGACDKKETTEPKKQTEKQQESRTAKQTEKQQESHALKQKDVFAATRTALTAKTKMNIFLPTKIPLSNEKKVLSAYTEGQDKGYTVTFFESNSPLPVDSAALSDSNQAKQIAKLSVKKYETKEEAGKSLCSTFKLNPDYEKDVPSKDDPSAIDLGNGIKGFTEGAAGTMYLNFVKDHWAIFVKSPSTNKDDNISVAKSIVNQLEKEPLPTPNSYAVIEVDNRLKQNRVYWQNGDTLYGIETSGSIQDALTIAAHFESTSK
ncbi:MULTISPECIES: hypothetical protein [unclassified Bacillus (in: firmicutes)]|uniref:hypothetical protein n=1 Tax=unclassified Bacillus (in: firmicutes) TaxID=185979 RepID=UPI0008EBD760|nr:MULTISPECIES: hypothetical protein [unclassified Bacillus (in: firmicutes)]SFI74480.1 hypothetical protein SAMN04488574_104148 [Bacillus sp. 71mf]SFS87906.1 hypothetical protein SAMN04488145_104218 [Bacillus sp. 103mf]